MYFRDATLEENDPNVVDMDLESVSASARAEIHKHRGEAIDELKMLRTHERSLLRDLRYFTKVNQLNREAQYPESQRFALSLLAALVIIEAVLNCYFFGKGSEFGLLGGWFQASIVALANVGVSFVAGIVGFRNISHVKPFRKVAGSSVSVVHVGLISFFNLATAHYRVLLDLDPGNAVKLSIQHLWAHPFNIANFDAVVLLCVGLISSIIACIDGYTLFDDVYPGYGKFARQHTEAEKTYEDRKQKLRVDMGKVADRAITLIDQRLKYVDEKIERCLMVLRELPRTVEELPLAADQIERVCHGLLSRYREENMAIRLAKSPAYFSALPTLDKSLCRIDPISTSEKKKSLEGQLASVTKRGNQIKSELRQSVEKEIENLSKLVDQVEEAVRKELVPCNRDLSLSHS